MGTYSGKLLTVYISPTGVRVAEGENRGGNPNISRFFMVPAVEEFFSEIPGSAGNYEVINMSGLIDAILDECANQRTTAKRVMVSTNCLGISTEVSSEAGRTAGFKELLTADLGKKKKDKGAGDTPRGSLGTLQCKISWGDLVKDGKATRQVTTTVGDKFILQSMVQEFFQRGYQVISVSDCVGTLMNFRQTEEATFDHKGKVIFDFDTTFHYIDLIKDLPVKIDKLPNMDAFELSDRIITLAQDAVDTVGRNPKIFLTGSMMRDTQLYCQLIDKLESTGYTVYDLFDRPMVDPDTGMEPGTGRPVLTPDYAINIAMLMSAYAKNVVALTPKVGMDVMFKQNSKALAAVALGVALLFFATSAFFAALTVLDVVDMRNNPPRVDSLQGQINSLSAQKSQLQATIDTLTQADVTVLDTLNFIYANKSPLISIISIDTRDMLASTAVDSSGTIQGVAVDENGKPVGGVDASHSVTSREAIVIRGYARQAEAAVDFYNRLFHYGLPYDPVLNGVEKFFLPNGSEVFIFEIEIGVS